MQTLKSLQVLYRASRYGLIASEALSKAKWWFWLHKFPHGGHPRSCLIWFLTFNTHLKVWVSRPRYVYITSTWRGPINLKGPMDQWGLKRDKQWSFKPAGVQAVWIEGFSLWAFVSCWYRSGLRLIGVVYIFLQGIAYKNMPGKQFKNITIYELGIKL